MCGGVCDAVSSWVRPVLLSARGAASVSASASVSVSGRRKSGRIISRDVSGGSSSSRGSNSGSGSGSGDRSTCTRRNMSKKSGSGSGSGGKSKRRKNWTGKKRPAAGATAGGASGVAESADNFGIRVVHEDNDCGKIRLFCAALYMYEV